MTIAYYDSHNELQYLRNVSCVDFVAGKMLYNCFGDPQNHEVAYKKIAAIADSVEVAKQKAEAEALRKAEL